MTFFECSITVIPPPVLAMFTVLDMKYYIIHLSLYVTKIHFSFRILTLSLLKDTRKDFGSIL